MTRTYSTKYQTAEAAAEYDEVICRRQNDAVWAAERVLLERLIRRHVQDPSRAKVVDFACGTGRILEVLRPIAGELVGIDISPAMLARAAVAVPGVTLVCADIVAEPSTVPSNVDLITSFRFLLLAEPSLREACMRVLAQRLAPGRGIMIVNTHGNPWSFRCIARVRDMLLRRDKRLPVLTMREVRALAARCGLDMIDATGCGFVPLGIQRVLPASWSGAIERAMAGMPLLWRCGTNVMLVLRPGVGRVRT